MLPQVLVGVALVGFAGFSLWDQHTMNVARIEGTLLGQHATDIRVQIDWSGLERHASTYDVSYTDGGGARQFRRCRIARHTVDGDILSWSPPL
jgi:hypothetical protein